MPIAPPKSAENHQAGDEVPPAGTCVADSGFWKSPQVKAPRLAPITSATAVTSTTLWAWPDQVAP